MLQTKSSIQCKLNPLVKLFSIEDQGQVTMPIHTGNWPLTLTYKPDFESQATMVITHIHTQKLKFKSQSVTEIEWKQAEFWINKVVFSCYWPFWIAYQRLLVFRGGCDTIYQLYIIEDFLWKIIALRDKTEVCSYSTLWNVRDAQMAYAPTTVTTAPSIIP